MIKLTLLGIASSIRIRQETINCLVTMNRYMDSFEEEATAELADAMLRECDLASFSS